jgi:hypothetical protein
VWASREYCATGDEPAGKKLKLSIGATVSDVDIDQLRRDVGGAIAEAVSRHEQSMVSRWVAVVETIEAADGERGLWCFASGDAKRWDTLGLLTFALDIERAKTVADRIRDED